MIGFAIKNEHHGVYIYFKTVTIKSLMDRARGNGLEQITELSTEYSRFGNSISTWRLQFERYWESKSPPPGGMEALLIGYCYPPTQLSDLSLFQNVSYLPPLLSLQERLQSICRKATLPHAPTSPLSLSFSPSLSFHRLTLPTTSLFSLSYLPSRAQHLSKFQGCRANEKNHRKKSEIWVSVWVVPQVISCSAPKLHQISVPMQFGISAAADCPKLTGRAQESTFPWSNLLMILDQLRKLEWSITSMVPIQVSLFLKQMTRSNLHFKINIS